MIDLVSFYFIFIVPSVVVLILSCDCFYFDDFVDSENCQIFILKGNVKYSSSYSTLCAGLQCERFIDINRLQVIKSNATYHWLV